MVCSLENLFSQYNEIISTSKLLFHNPLVMKYYSVLAYFSLDYENCPLTKISWLLLLSPRFFKKASGILQSPPSVRTLSPPKSLDEIQPNLVCELLT